MPDSTFLYKLESYNKEPMEAGKMVEERDFSQHLKGKRIKFSGEERDNDGLSFFKESDSRFLNMEYEIHG